MIGGAEISVQELGWGSQVKIAEHGVILQRLTFHIQTLAANITLLTLRTQLTQ